MAFIIGAFGLFALAGAIVLVRFIGKGSETRQARTTWLAAAFAVASVVALGTFSFASVYFRMPSAWIVALAAAGLVALRLFTLVGMDVRWQWRRVLALVGLFVLTGIAFGAIVMIVPGGAMIQSLYATRTQQIAEEYGFTALLPTSQEMPTDYLPVETLAKPDEGLSITYNDFWLQERKAAKAMTQADLEQLVAPGVALMGDGPGIPADAKLSTHSVRDQPAVAVEYSYVPGRVSAGAAKSPENAVGLVFELDGVEVRMLSESGQREDNGEWEPFASLTVNELLTIAGTFEPVE